MPTINRTNKIQEKKVDYPHHNNISAKYYNTSRWHNLRDWYIKQHPFCELCESKGIVRLAEEVHHKTEFLRGQTEEERWKLLTDVDNLQSLCCECHNNIHYGKKDDDEEK